MIETILAFFALGTFGFWALALVASIIFTIAVENEHFKFSTFLTVLLTVFYGKAVLAVVNWKFLALGLIVYALIGVGWSVHRWFRRVQQTANRYREDYGQNLTASQRDALKQELKVSKHKARIVGWIAYWPWSLLWNVVGDFFNTLYETMQATYQKITDRALNKFGTLEEKKPEVPQDDYYRSVNHPSKRY